MTGTARFSRSTPPRLGVFGPGAKSSMRAATDDWVCPCPQVARLASVLAAAPPDAPASQASDWANPMPARMRPGEDLQGDSDRYREFFTFHRTQARGLWAGSQIFYSSGNRRFCAFSAYAWLHLLTCRAVFPTTTESPMLRTTTRRVDLLEHNVL
jgi:hypothetical protein